MQVVAQSEYHGERRSEFVGDIGEKGLAQRREPFQFQMVTLSDTLNVEQLDDQAQQEEHHNGEEYDSVLFRHSFLIQAQPHLVRLPFLPIAFNSKASVLDTVHLLQVHHAVLHDGSLLVGCQSRAIITLPLENLIIQGVDLRKVLLRAYAFRYRLCLAEIVQGLCPVPHHIVDARKGDE